MKRFWTTSMFALLALLVGCSRIEIQSNMRQGYERKLDRVCILVSNSRESDASFFEIAKVHLEEGLRLRGVKGSMVVLKAAHREAGDAQGLSPAAFLPVNSQERMSPSNAEADPLPDPATLQAKTGFLPAYLLQIRMSSEGRSVEYFGGPNPSSSTTDTVTLHFVLTEIERNLRIWKAEQSIGWSAMFKRPVGSDQASPISVDAQKFADNILQQLQKDGLLDAPGQP